ncbi:MAG TPA: YlxR family protein [Desulfurivibrionaceae bacterium]|nr:YlxR family protein [Desulfurivibrionaceae bacterium]
MKFAALRPLPVEPERTCLGCGARFPKGELRRFVLRAGVLGADLTGLLPGRGAYCCRREGCLKKFAARKGRLTKALRSEVVDCRVVHAICADEFGSEPGRV